MEPLSVKQRNEQAAFARFIGRLGEENHWSRISSRPEPEPDLLCTHIEEGEIAFELVSLTDPLIAKVQAAGERARTDAFSTSDPSERIIRNKLHKTYKTNICRIELLIYTDGQIMTTDDEIIPTIQPWFDAIHHPFKRIWFMGQFETSCLWSVV
ncbi:hypothetical protein [Methylotenera versatilis]|uniref:Uncharacterized protein n=1 Tax=Methylotenera versatilis (strain 301) TaxID=666681 RepID=D7DQ73_METV0|nr:hypothetical protein [Methylotenera versatilis]ADI29444.1 hypothetical protein M301_1060 [Methylotenera versatilis 301]